MAKTPTTKRKPAAKVPKNPGTQGGARKRTAARKAAAQAKAAGAIGPWGSTGSRGMRNLAIVAGMAAGADVQEVASEFGISVKTVREVCQGREARPSMMSTAPMEILEGFLGETQDTLDRLKAAANGAAAANNLPVLVGAAKAEVIVRHELMELAQAVGLLPVHLSWFAAESTLRAMAKEMGSAVRRLRSGEITIDEMEELFTQIASEHKRDRQKALPRP
jgi:predicted transcriptional regulator